MLDKIGQNTPKDTLLEMVIVDDDSPDGTGKIVEDYINFNNSNDDRNQTKSPLRISKLYIGKKAKA